MTMKNCIILLATIVLGLLCSCENKRDHNGKLAGMWQMTYRTAPDGTAQQTEGLYYVFRNSIIKFQDSKDNSRYHLAYFTRHTDTLSIYNIVEYPSDKLCSPQELQAYGVPEDGKFIIEILTKSSLVLHSKDCTLSFRKY